MGIIRGLVGSDEYIAMAEDLLKKTVLGNKYIPVVPTPQQAVFLTLPHRDAFYGGQAGPGKALSIDTDIPTPYGWTTMGELSVGDEVFDECGRICHVLAVSEIHYDKTYEVSFSDGSQFIVGGSHQWVTSNLRERARLLSSSESWRQRRRAKRPSRATGNRSEAFSRQLSERNSKSAKVKVHEFSSVRTTEEIRDSLYNGKRINHSVAVASSLELAHIELPIDPYVLGAWLGDGHSASGIITGIDDGVFEQVVNGGYAITRGSVAITRRVVGLTTQLRRLGVLGNKHIPQVYLRASAEQRLALLQGLMDTDGTCASDGSCEISLTRKALVDGVYELILSLGIKCTLRQRLAKLKGRIIGPCWRIGFLTKLPAFRLPRKLLKQKRSGFRGTHDRRYIVAVEPVEPIPLKCIKVDSPSECFLAGRQMIPTHNSTALLMGALQFVHSKNSHALVLRRNFADLALHGALMDKAHEWLAGFPEVTWNEREHKYTFPTGATVNFGYMETERDKYRYQGADFTYIAPDEATQFAPSQLTYLFSRLRKDEGTDIPCRFRAASNPGNIGHEFIKHRYIDPGHPDKPFVPAALKDNPHIAYDDYMESLKELDKVTYGQLAEGCWDDPTPEGSYYSKFLEDAENEGRITTVPYDKGLPVDTWWDLGSAKGRDSMIIGLTQTDGLSIRFIDVIAGSGEGLPFYAKALNERGYLYRSHNAPHDIGVREIGSGKTRLETAYSLGLRFNQVPDIGIDNGIHQVRQIFNRVYFDRMQCATLLKALRNYRKEWNDAGQCWNNSPVKDWTNDYADMFRMFAVGWEDVGAHKGRPIQVQTGFNVRHPPSVINSGKRFSVLAGGR